MLFFVGVWCLVCWPFSPSPSSVCIFYPVLVLSWVFSSGTRFAWFLLLFGWFSSGRFFGVLGYFASFVYLLFLLVYVLCISHGFDFLNLV